ncbi:MAG: T9SS type A sorting domain-containing protein [Flavobacteriales bacterium]|nr:T9SS type A sorting domain-containing protein [Flavobacteriales bacterium]
MCAGGTTGIVPNSTCLDCLGVPNGAAQPGSTCDDNNGNTINDVWSANCTCAGVPANFDCAGVSNGTAAVDQCGVCAGGTTGIVPNSTCLDCLGVPNGAAQPGSTCDDNNANTAQRPWGGKLFWGWGKARPARDSGKGNGGGGGGGDNNANTTNDVWSNSCTCSGNVIPVDCEGVVNGSALPGAACDDGNPDTGNDQWDTNCFCAGLLIDCLGVPGGQSMPGSACDDNNAATINDSWTINCQCIGVNTVLDCAGVPGGTAFIDLCGICAAGNTGIIPNPDSDGDGHLDCEDNCKLGFNPDQADFDIDGIGDVCDNCPWVFNPLQEDFDGNNIGDDCEAGSTWVTEHAEALFTVYPNPVRGELTLAGSLEGIVRLEFYTLLGAKVFDTSPVRSISTDDWATGIYFIIALDADGRPLQRIRLVK